MSLSKEQNSFHPEESFSFTDEEQLHNRVSHERFEEFFNHQQTTVHRVSTARNTYGEFLFITASQPQKPYISFWGLGFHEYRERWLIDEWFWYPFNPPETLPDEITKEKAAQEIRQRIDEIAHYGTPDVQSNRGKLFERLAMLMDEAGAWSVIREEEEGRFDDQRFDDDLNVI